MNKLRNSIGSLSILLLLLIIMGSAKNVYGTSILANSGSPADIQAAVDQVSAAGGGTVSVPAGTFTFNPPMNGIGVSLPPSVSLIGAGIGQTVLQETVNSGQSKMISSTGQFITNIGVQGSPIRVSGITFKGFVLDEVVTNNVGLSLSSQKDFRVDHCSFLDFDSCGISTSGNLGGTWPMNYILTRGVIDHCSFDNPYKDAWAPKNSSVTQWAVWGYGIIVVGDYCTWDPNIADYLGQYNPILNYSYTLSNGGQLSVPTPAPVYIENCDFTRCRHAIASNGNAYYISRYNHFQKASPYGQCDVHGNAGNGIGGRGLESYSNIFDLSDESYSFGQDAAVDIRGGGGVCFNNTVILNPSYGTPTVLLLTESIPPYDVEQFYIWDNTAKLTDGTPIDFNSRINNNQAGYVQGVNYFLRAPTQAQDGFSYTPFVYPHPLVSGEVSTQTFTQTFSSTTQTVTTIVGPGSTSSTPLVIVIFVFAVIAIAVWRTKTKHIFSQ